MKTSNNEKKIKGINLAAICAVLALLLVGLPLSMAWYHEINTDFGGTQVEGRIRAAYFHSGNGKSSYKAVYPEGDVGHTSVPSYDAYGNAAFEIYTAEEFHNLAWLQYMGIFDDETVHFYLSNNIDMSGYVLPPIGTELHPFIGNFDGGNFTLSNLHISAGVVDETSSSGNATLCDVGLFGYLDTEAQVRNLYAENLTIDLTGAATNDLSNSHAGHNASAHYLSGDSVAYVGYIAGHIQKAASCENVYVNNCSIVGGGAARCGYGYFGCVEIPGEGPAPSLGTTIAQIHTSGINAGFGGSIDMFSLYSRLNRARTLARNEGQYIYPSVEVNLLNSEGEVVMSYAAETGSSNSNANRPIWIKPGEKSGIYAFHNRTDAPQFIYVNGKNSVYSKITRVYQESASQIPAYFISDLEGVNFIELTPEITVSNATGSSSVAWSLDSDAHLYTNLATEQYYLNRNGEALEVSTTAQTEWVVSVDRICTNEAVPYYINYSASSGWQLSPDTQSYHIYDNNSHYLSLSGQNVINAREVNASTWLLSDPSGDTSISVKIEGVRYYLTVNNGALRLSTSPVIWTKTGNAYHVSIDGHEFYLTYDRGWKAVNIEGYLISDGHSNYLGITNNLDGVSNLTSPKLQSLWQLSDPEGTSTTVSITGGGKTSYLTYNGGLTVSETPFIWSRDDKGLYILLHGAKCHLSFGNSAWGIVLDSWFEISRGGDNYLAVNTARDGLEAVGSAAAENAKWQIENPAGSGQIYSVIGGVKYPLLYSDGLVLGTAGSNGTVWSYSSDKGTYYASSGGKEFYLSYNNGWTAAEAFGYVISDGNGHYISVENGAITTAASAEGAAECVFSVAASGSNPPSGKIRVEGASQHYYLAYVPGQGLQLAVQASSGSSWVWDSAKSAYYCLVGNTRYYLHYSGGWKADLISWNIINSTSGAHYLSLNADKTGITEQSSASGENVRWQMDTAAASTSIYCAVNGQNYYLGNSGGALTVSGTPTTWVKDGESYYTGSDPAYYLSYGNGWKSVSITRYKIHSGSAYIGMSGTDMVTSDAAGAYMWDISSPDAYGARTISAIVNGTRYYLVYSSNAVNGLALATTAQNGNWGTDNALGTGFVNVGGTKYYLTYKKVSASEFAWCASELSYRIKSSSSEHYITIDDYYNVEDSSVDYDSEWVFSDTSNIDRPSGTIRDMSTGRYLYARRSGGFFWNPTYELVSNASSGTSFYWISGGLRANGARYVYYSSSTGWNEMRNSAYGLSVIKTVTGIQLENVSVTKPLIAVSANGVNISAASAGERDNNIGADFVQKNAAITALSISPRQLSPGNIHISAVDDVQLGLGATTQKEWVFVSETGSQKGGQPSYFPLRLELSNEENNTSFYSDYRVSPKNTGYILGGTYTSSSYSADIRVSSYGINNIRRSYSQNSSSFTNIYTINAGGQKTVSEADGFTEFENSKTKLLKVLNGQNNVYGLHFMDAQVSRDHLVIADQATILGNTYHYYEMPEDSIDFQLIERGVINFFAGTYFINQYGSNPYVNDAFFSLHEIKRNSHNKISEIKEIREIWRHAQLPSESDYIYKYADGSYSSTTVPSSPVYEKVFDAGWITGDTVPSLTDYAVYYFEIPCNSGEYALGSVSGKTGAYLMYLDIAANGGDTQDTIVSGQGNAVTDSYTVEYRDYDKQVERSILQFSVNAPEAADSSDFTVNVSFDESADTIAAGNGEYDRGLYTININNKSGSAAELHVLLCDDDNDLQNLFPYAYRVVYTNSAYGTEQIIMNGSKDYWKIMNGFNIPSDAAASTISF